MPPKRQLRVPTPREIRRAFGAPALQAVNSHADAIASLNAQVAFLTDLQQSTKDRLALLEQASFDTARDLRKLKADHDAWPMIGWVARLHWLFTGK